MYEAREQEDILTELQETSSSPASKIEGTFENDVLVTNSIEFGKMEVELEQMYKAAFAETSWGEYLTMIAAEFGVDRKAASKATGTVTVTGTGTVSKGSRFSTSAGNVFVTTKEADIKGSGDIPVEASLEGADGNVAAGTIVNIPISIPGILSVTNAKAASGGYDEESDEDLLKRYYIAVRTPATSGNKWHYYNWAMSVKGVGDCRVRPLWNGPGTVKVLIVDSNHQTAADTLIKAVADYIEKMKFTNFKGGTVEPKPNEPRGAMFLPTSGHAVGFIMTRLKKPDFWGVNPELLQHEGMTLLNSVLTVSYLCACKKLKFLHFGSQIKGQFDNDFPPLVGPEGLKETAWMFRALADCGWKGVVEFDCHMLRAEGSPENPADAQWRFIRSCSEAVDICVSLAERLKPAARGANDTEAELAAIRQLCAL